MDTKLFIQVCKDEYGAVVTMMRRIIELCPPELWDLFEDEPPFWQQAYHAIWATNWFFSESRDEFPELSFEEGRSDLAKRWDTPLSQEDVLAYLDSTEKKGLAYMESLTTSSLELANPFDWTGPTVANRMIYNMRHCVQHLGWLESYLSRHGNIPLGWTFWNQEEKKYKFSDEEH